MSEEQVAGDGVEQAVAPDPAATEENAVSADVEATTATEANIAPEEDGSAAQEAGGEEGAPDNTTAEGEEGGESGAAAGDGDEGGEGGGGEEGQEGEEGGEGTGEEGGDDIAEGEDQGEGAADAEKAAANVPPAVDEELLAIVSAEDYVPVAQLPPIAAPYALDEEGCAVPLPGVESVFLTGTTTEILGIKDLGAGGASPLMTISKEKILADVQFRGAISDFHALKSKIVEADYDPIGIRANEDDLYGDGNNYEVAFSRSAMDVWEFILAETKRRAALAATEVAYKAIKKSQPRVKKVIVPKPWVSLGSEIEMEEAGVKPRRELIRISVQRKRREFNQGYKLQDKDAHELWNSSQMECRPFKDPNFDLRKMEQDSAVQAVPVMVDVGVQSTGQRPRPNSTQTAPLDLDEADKLAQVAGPDVIKFLDSVRDQCEEALIQNEVTNIFVDDFETLTEEEGGLSGNRKESMITETQSFTHLTYSKNKVVSAIQWLPHRKGVVAVACTEAISHAERVARAGRPGSAYILIWNFKDPIHPEYVLQCPFEVFCFQYNPMNPEIIVGGCYNGQVVIWDTTNEHERIAKMKLNSNKEQSEGDDATIPIVKFKYLTAVEFSHHNVVTDLKWLPNVEVTSKGKVTKAGDAKDCNFFATVAGDGKVNFWDIRVEKLMKKGRGRVDDLDLTWKPVHSVHMISLQGMNLSGARFCFDFHALERGQFYVGSADGELVYAEFIKPDGEENPDYIKSCLQAHVGPIVAIERSSFFEDVVLSVGDWRFQIWKEGQTTPIFESGYANDYYTCGCWSPTRPAVIYLVDQSGNLEIWDLLDRSHEPSIKTTLASVAFNSMSFNISTQANMQANQLLSLGDSAGVLHIMELPRNLRRPVPNEKRLMASLLDREMDRVMDTAARQPLRAKSVKEQEEKRKVSETDKAGGEDDMAGRDSMVKDQSGAPGRNKKDASVFDEKAEMEYIKMENRFKLQLGLIPQPSPGR